MSPWDVVELGAERCIAHTQAGAVLTVQLSPEPHALRVAVLGALDEGGVALLSDCLTTLAARGNPRFVVDLRRATSISREASESLLRADFAERVELVGVDRRVRMRMAARRYARRRLARAA